MKNLFLIAAAFLLFDAKEVFSQKKPLPKRTAVKTQKAAAKPSERPSPAADEAAFQLKLQDSLKAVEEWREYEFARDNFRISFPRQPVFKQEISYEEPLGKVQINSYYSLGDRALFAAAHLRLPYTIDDAQVLREFYQTVSKEILDDGSIQITETKDVQINEKLGLELIGTSKNNPTQKIKMRIVLINKDVFYTLVTPFPSGSLSVKQNNETRAAVEKETSDFFDSFAEMSGSTIATVQPVAPQFKSTFAGGIFKSDYFNFTVKIPAGSREVSQEDVSGIRESGREIIKHNSKLNVATATSERRNLFTFAGKPLGSEKNYSFACNLIKQPTPDATIGELSELTEETVAQIKLFKITKKTHKIFLGDAEFVGFETEGVVGEEAFRQSIYFLLRKKYALNFVLIYYSDEEKKILLDALASIKFDAR